MKKSKFTEEQIAFALRQAETGTRVAEMGSRSRRFSDGSVSMGALGYQSSGV